MTLVTGAPALRCLGLSKRFGDIVAVDGIDLDLPAGQTLAVIGPSGCGKTTLLRLVAGLETPDGGTVEAEGTLLSGPRRFVAPEQRKVGIVFQEFALFPHLDVAANVAYGVVARGTDRRRRVAEMLELVGLQGMEGRLPHQLSGGEQQRVALARALAPQPRVLLMDEPFSNLDTDRRVRVRREIKEILRRANATVMFVTHDQEEALFMGDRVAIMRDGRLEQIGTPEDVYHRPATTFVGRFVGAADFLPARVEGGAMLTEIGPVAAPVPPAAGARKQATGAGLLEVLVRPDDLSLRPSPSGHGVIVERTFTGPTYLYHVALDSGTICRALLPCTAERLAPGTRVEVEVSAGHSLLSFMEGRIVAGDDPSTIGPIVRPDGLADSFPGVAANESGGK